VFDNAEVGVPGVPYMKRVAYLLGDLLRFTDVDGADIC
jgi:hypothetical protein